MHPEIFITAFVILFVVLVVVGAIIFLVMEACDKLDTLREKAPWFVKLIERRESLNVLLAVCLFLLLGNGYELIMKEVPGIPEPPIVKILPPVPPQIVVDNPKVIIHTLPPPEQPLRIHTVSFGLVQKVALQGNGRIGRAFVVVGLTNKTITPVDVTLTCNHDIESLGQPWIGTTQRVVFLSGASATKINNTTFNLQVGMPAWTVDSPIGIPLFTEADDTVCTIKEN
jgi:hypothetical protein